MTDFLICSLPFLQVDRVPGAPALLKSAAQSAGFSANALDLNIEFFTHQCQGNVDTFFKLAEVFKPNYDSTDESTLAGQAWVDHSIKIIQKHQPTVLGLSVFSVYQHRATIMLINKIKEVLPKTKIILGGFGVNISANSLFPTNQFKKIDLIKPFHQLVLENKLVDRVFFGNDLDQLIDYLKENCGSTQEIEKFDTHGVKFNTPIPDYDDYNLDLYVWNNSKSLPVTGSRGCVRQCTFVTSQDNLENFHIETELTLLRK
jgi:hypothetical protein